MSMIGVAYSTYGMDTMAW